MSRGRMREVASVDLMRLLAAEAVMFYHFAFMAWAEAPRALGIRAIVQAPEQLRAAIGAQGLAWASLGWVGVPVFFVISGFVILLSAEGKTAAEFLAGRVVRIVPGLWCLSALSALVMVGCGVLGAGEAAVRLLRSLVLFPVGPWIDGAVWTLVAEAVFYGAVYLAIRTGAIARVPAILGAVTAWDLLFWSAVLAGDAGLLGSAGHRLAGLAASYPLRVTLVTTNGYFAVGAALYLLFRGRDPRRSGVLLALNFAMALVATYYAALSSVGVARFGQSPLGAVAVWGAATALLCAAALLRWGTGGRLARLAAWAGLLTYPLYLLNQITGGLLLRLACAAGCHPVRPSHLRHWPVPGWPRCSHCCWNGRCSSACRACSSRSGSGTRCKRRPDMLRIFVVIATLGRPALVARTVDLLAGQTRRADGIVVSSVSPRDVAGVGGGAEVVLGGKGLCRQRNRALDALAGRADIAVFFDDDFVPAPDYLARVEALFTAQRDVVGATAALLADGVRCGGLSLDEARALVRRRPLPISETLADRSALYGCNMAIRLRAAHGLRFDENLPLYGWQEDVDFSMRLGRRGRLVCGGGLAGVHMGVQGARTSGRRLGYSQVANVIYLRRKGTLAAAFAARLATRNLLANALGSLRPEPATGGGIDRRGRLLGNAMALADCLRGRVDPRRILDI